jgi:predicted nucleotidyltransferase
MTVADEIESLRGEILNLAAKHGAGNIEVFGSVARREETVDSDIDLLVDVVGRTTPWFPGGFVADLEALLGRRVQIVIRRALSPLVRNSVLKDARPL